MACANADIPSTQLTQEAAEASVLCLINEQRAAVGVPPLTLNLKLRVAARQQANDARTLKWWAGGGSAIHTNPVTGSTPQSRIKAAGYCPDEQAPPMNENGYAAFYSGGIAYQDGTSPNAAVTWWMGSQGHRTTLLDPRYTETGMAVVLGVAERGPEADRADGGAIFVQIFGGCAQPETPGAGLGWTWGYNGHGELGDDTTLDRHTPVRPLGLADVSRVAGGGYHSLALTSAGNLWAWGLNDSGQVGDGSKDDRHKPVQIAALTGVIAMDGGGYHTIAVTADGTVWAWGANGHGQLGNGTGDDRNEPDKVINIAGVIAVAAGFNHSLALRGEGDVWAWGNNEYGQLGDGTTTRRRKPVRVGRLEDVIAISAGFGHSLALRRDGTVWAWGDNTSGQLGDNTFTARTSPVQVLMSSISRPIAAIVAGGVHSMALEQSGGVYTWGGNAYGQLGNGDTVDRWLPVRPQYLFGITALAAGFGHSLVLTSAGAILVWGGNYSGQVGDGTTTDVHIPFQLAAPSGVTGIACGMHHSLAP